MRNLILTAQEDRRPAAIFIAVAGPMSPWAACAADVTTSRAYSVLVAGRAQNILA